jgi:hypothetical protein
MVLAVKGQQRSANIGKTPPSKYEAALRPSQKWLSLLAIWKSDGSMLDPDGLLAH